MLVKVTEKSGGPLVEQKRSSIRMMRRKRRSPLVAVMVPCATFGEEQLARIFFKLPNRHHAPRGRKQEYVVKRQLVSIAEDERSFDCPSQFVLYEQRSMKQARFGCEES
jgi:hypothetical protein